MTEHDRIIESLTWFLNGSLDAREQARVLQHLEQCPVCRSELTLQQQVRGAITQPVKIEFAPQTSFNKLWDRIDNEELSGDRKGGKQRTPSARFGWLHTLRRNWMPLALATQLLLIVGLLSVLLYGQDATAPYRTVTTDSDADRPIIHAVFDEATRLSDVKDILGKAGLEVASGPTAAGVYSLTPDSAHDVAGLKATVAALRADPRVRFAELSHP